jgi:hypothetical protein
MALTNVFTGSNGTLTLANEDSPEGKDAQDVIDLYAIQTVGRVTNVEVYVYTDLEEFHEIGRRHPTSLAPGNVHISGKVRRAYINGSLLFLLLGRGAAPTSTAEPYVQPTFNIVVNLTDPATPGNFAALEIQGVKFQNWVYVMPEEDFVSEDLTFKALAIRVLDKDGGASISPISPTDT